VRCPFCAHDNSQVKDSRPTEDNTAIRRRRQCEGCGARFTTFERVQLREIMVVKSNQDREPFERDKIEQSVTLACRKRNVSQERIDQLVSGIQAHISDQGPASASANNRTAVVNILRKCLEQAAADRELVMLDNCRGFEAVDFLSAENPLDALARSRLLILQQPICG